VEKSLTKYDLTRFSFPDFAVSKCENHKCKVLQFFIIWKFLCSIKNFYAVIIVIRRMYCFTFTWLPSCIDGVVNTC
jgi:hypothetical protein